MGDASTARGTEGRERKPPLPLEGERRGEALQQLWGAVSLGLVTRGPQAGRRLGAGPALIPLPCFFRGAWWWPFSTASSMGR